MVKVISDVVAAVVLQLQKKMCG